MPNQLTRIESKLDALLTKQGIKPNDVVKTAPAAAPVELTAAEQEALDNAPRPTPLNVPADRQARVTATGAPDTGNPQGASTPAQPTRSPEQQLEAETGRNVVQTGTEPPTFVETDKPAPKPQVPRRN